MSDQRYEFVSAAWRAFMHGLITERLSQLGGEAKEVDWSFCEVFTNAPEHLRTDGSNAAWHCVVRAGELSFGSTVLDDATFTVTADYEAILPLARYDTRGEEERAAELARLSEQLMAEGKMKLSGDPGGLDPRLGSFHDAVAAVTA